MTGSATGAFTATGSLTRFTVRRDRVRILVWIGAIALLVASTVASVQGLYPTQADLDAAAVASQDNAGAIIFNGPPQGLDTVGGQVAFQTGTFGLILMGLMSVFMLGRLTRGEEEAGRVELVRSLPVGAHASPAAALITVAAMDVVSGLLVVAVGIGLGLPVAGSVAFGLSFATFGLLLAAVTAVVAQITDNTRVVYGIGGLVLGTSFLLRAIGDIGDGTVSWLSPIGWAQKTRPWAGEVWWPFLLLVGATALCTWAALVLSRRRDLGGGLVAPRAGPARASAWLGGPFGLAGRLQRVSVVGWTASLAVLAVAYGSIADSIQDFVEDNEALTDIIAAQGGGTLIEQYVVMSFRILALIAAGFALQSALRIRSEESAGRAEDVLATPVSRTRLALGHLVIAFAGSLGIMVVSGLAFGLADAAVRGRSDLITTAVVAALTYTPAVWVLVGVTVALIGCAPRLSPWAWGILALCFVIGMFGQLLGLPGWVEGLSPFQRVPEYPAADLEPVPLVVLSGVALGLTTLGLVGFRRRDVG
ncbi:MAG: ABC transporter permease [Actinobacteria bacterium]|nr:ABC transporter permease [Actinomycetota bacterium]